jgi:hypothetical protein
VLPPVIEIADIISQDRSQVTFGDDDHPIQALDERTPVISSASSLMANADG